MTRWLLFSLLAICPLPSEEIDALKQRIERVEKQLSFRPPQFQPKSFDARGAAHAEGEFLFWKFTNLGMPYAYQAEQNKIAFAGALTTNERIRNISFSYEPGFRINLGYILPFEEWEAIVRWTRINASNTGFTEGRRENEFVFPYWNFTFDTFAVLFPRTVHANMEIHLNSVAMELGRFFFIQKSFALKPSIGLIAAWIKQRQDIRVDGFVSVGVLEPTFSEATLINGFSGCGLRGGLELRIVLRRGWELFGTLFSLLWRVHPEPHGAHGSRFSLFYV